MCKEKTCCVLPIVFGILGALLLIASFVIPYVLYQAVGQGFYSASTINTPQTNQNDYNHYISNNFSDSSVTYYSYYFWNTTNIDAIVNSHAAPLLQEVGPYTYQQFYQYYYVDPVSQTPKLGVYFNQDISTATFAEITTQWFQTGNHPIYGYPLSCSGCNDQTDRIISPSVLYATLFFNPSNPLLTSEYAVRLGLSSVALPGLLTALNNSLIPGVPLLANPSALVEHLLGLSQFNTYYQSNYGITSLYGLFQFLSAANPQFDPYGVLTGSPLAGKYRDSFEYLGVGNAGSLDQYLLPYGYPAFGSGSGYTLTNSNQYGLLYLLSLNCTDSSICGQCHNLDLSLGSKTGGGLCWQLIGPQNVTNFLSTTPYSGILSSQQIGGIWAWLTYTSNITVSLFFDIEGMLGLNYAGVTRITPGGYVPVPYPTVASGTTLFYNNANMFCKKSPYQLLFQNSSILGAIAGSQEVGYVASAQRSLAADLTKSNDIVTINTGQTNILQTDEITAFSSGQPFTLNPPTSQTIYGSLTQGQTAIAAGASVEFCNWNNIGSNVTQTYNISLQLFNYPLRTRWTPTFPPGRQTSAYGWDNSIVSPSLNYNIFNTIIQRQANFSYVSTVSVQNIDVDRFTITAGSYIADPPGSLGFGVVSYALATYMCNGQPAFTSPPRFQLLNQTDAINVFTQRYNPLTYFPFAFASLSFINQTTILQTNPNLDVNNLLVFEDLERASGQLLRGSLKEQLNLIVFPYYGVSNQSVAEQLVYFDSGGYDSFMAPKNSYFWPILWSDKHGELTTSQANSLKFAKGALTAAYLVLIIGTIVGGVQMFVCLLLLIRYYRKKDSAYSKANSSIGLTNSSTALNTTAI